MSDPRREAISRLYEETGFLVLRRCLRMMNNPEEAMDATQWTFLRAWETDFEVRSRAEALAWLYRTAIRRCLWMLRNSTVRSRILGRHSEELRGMPRVTLDADVIGRDLLARAVHNLDDQTAELAMATYIHGLSNDRAAELYGVSVRTFGRARAAFEQALRELNQEAS